MDNVAEKKEEDYLFWNSSISFKDIDKTKQYLVLVEDFDFEIDCYTPFYNNGQCIKIFGTILFHLIKNKNKKTILSPAASLKIKPSTIDTTKRSHRNVCFKSVSSNKKNIIHLIKSTLRMPPCMLNLLNLIEIAPRGGRFKKRFVFNCYIVNLITCTKCNKHCIVDAMNTLYDYDEKCMREFFHLINKNNSPYKPPNCANMSKSNLCFKSSQCKGSNPLCNK
ncbi:lef2 [Hemileuca sp. nucleopolyhedrovirus]|uniref:Lef2 n=1 Tax=Hemileuca sp. nucleopolyhedrovirus TaxID=1367203 RepID=S5MK76_9ABAC|nr:lef2 [Hemileuca sp. nucleopolyhedrovirus]AGR56866.1 lef2 [Hemileuca sp. nucleopolyhedrovirus]